MEFVIFANFQDTIQENVLHKDHFTLILSDLLMGEVEEAEVLTVIFQEHLSLKEEGEEEEEGDNVSKMFQQLSEKCLKK